MGTLYIIPKADVDICVVLMKCISRQHRIACMIWKLHHKIRFVEVMRILSQPQKTLYYARHFPSIQSGPNSCDPNLVA